MNINIFIFDLMSLLNNTVKLIITLLIYLFITKNGQSNQTLYREL